MPHPAPQPMEMADAKTVDQLKSDAGVTPGDWLKTAPASKKPFAPRFPEAPASASSKGEMPHPERQANVRPRAMDAGAACSEASVCIGATGAGSTPTTTSAATGTATGSQAPGSVPPSLANPPTPSIADLRRYDDRWITNYTAAIKQGELMLSQLKVLGDSDFESGVEGLMTVVSKGFVNVLQEMHPDWPITEDYFNNQAIQIGAVNQATQQTPAAGTPTPPPIDPAQVANKATNFLSPSGGSDIPVAPTVNSPL